jgi:excisionase family DNA binding protein
MADLRASVAYLLRLRIPWTAQDLATLAAVPLPRARAYVAQLATATPCEPMKGPDGKPLRDAAKKLIRVPLLTNPDGTLVAPGAVRIDDRGQVLPGPYARRWIALEPFTRPGGNSSEYLRQREVRAELERRAWLAARAGTLAVLTSEPAESAENAGERQGNEPTVPAPQPLTDVPLTVKQAAEQLQVLPETVREWIHAGRLRAWRVGPQQIRVAQSEVARLLTPVAPRRAPKRELVRRG